MGGFLALLLSSLLSIFWPASTIDGVAGEGLKNDMGLFVFIWIYSLVTFAIQDCVKVGVFAWMHKTNFNDIAKTGVVILPPAAKQLRKDLEMALEEEEEEALMSA